MAKKSEPRFIIRKNPLENHVYIQRETGYIGIDVMSLATEGYNALLRRMCQHLGIPKKEAA